MKRSIVYGGSTALLVTATIGFTVFRLRQPPCFAPVPAMALIKEFPRGEAAMLLHPDRFELLSLYPKEQGCFQANASCFHGFSVLGRADIKDVGQRQQLVGALYGTIMDREGALGSAACFSARHGLHLTKQGKTLDVLICFQCGQTHTSGPAGARLLPASETGRKTFEAAVRSTQLPVPPF